MSEESEGPVRSTLYVWSIYLFVLTLCGAFLWPSLHWTFGYDQGTFAYGGSALLKGLKPYVDFWDIKPPNIFYVYAFGFKLFGESEFAIRLLDYLNALLTISLIWLVALRLWKHSSWIIYAASLSVFAYAIQYVIQGFSDTAQAETYSLPLILLAVLFVLPNEKHSERRAFLRLALSGFALAICFYFKFPNGIFLPFCMVMLWLQDSERHERLRSIGVLVLAFVVGICIESAYLAVNGELVALWNITVGSTLHYSQTNFSGSFGPLQNLRTAFTVFFPFAIIFSSIGWLVWLLRKSYRRTDELRSLMLLVLAVILALIAVQIQNKGYKYHYQIVLPWVALLIGAGIAQLFQLLKRWDFRTRIAIWAASGILLFGVCMLASSSPFGNAASDLRMEHSIDSVQNNLVRYVDLNTKPTDRIFIFGFQPYVYWAAKRTPATRFLNTIHFKPLYVDPELRNELVQSLTHQPPKLILVETDDHYTSQGDTHDDSRTVIRNRYPEIDQLLHDRYILRDTVQGEVLAYFRTK